MPRDVTVHAVLPVMDAHIRFEDDADNTEVTALLRTAFEDDGEAIVVNLLRRSRQTIITLLPTDEGLVEAGLARAKALGCGSVFELLSNLNTGNVRSAHTLDELERL